MHILVHTLTGRKCDLTIDGTSKVSSVQKEIESQMGIPVESQKLLSSGKELDSELLISELTSEEEVNMYLVVDLEGGAKGKKKKKQVKKTKKPHKHRKNKLGVLNYYKVDGDTIIRLKQQCMICPPGNYNKVLLT